MPSKPDSYDPSTVREAAICYLCRGWQPIPVPYRSKDPGLKGWPELRITEESLPDWFPGGPQNMGLLMGQPSGWLVDVDLDHPRAVELAPQHLPATSAIFGRPGKLRSHYLYRVRTPVATKKYKSKSSGMIVELRSTGTQTIVPPSTHESGEPIRWDEAGEPEEVDPDLLRESIRNLANTVLIELGEKPKPSLKLSSATSPSSGPHQQEGGHLKLDSSERVCRCLEAMNRLRIVDHQDGSSRLFACACRLVEHDLADETALTLLRTYARENPFPKEWTDEEILKRLRDAERRCDRGAAFKKVLDEEGNLQLGTRNPETGKLVLSPKRTLPTGEAFVREFHEHPDGRTLHCQGGALLSWNGRCYAELEDQAVQSVLQRWLHSADRYIFNPRTEQSKLVPFESNASTIQGALEAIRAYVYLPASVESPCWLDQAPRQLPPVELIACQSGLFHLPTGRFLPATPQYFCTNALDFDPDPLAEPPTRWLAFLGELFGEDQQSISLLQQWFGYCLALDTSQQKILLMVGPKRSGKGTIGRILNQIIGRGNVCGPTTSSLAGPFGMQPLLGKSLAIVSDARFHGENISTVGERLLCISGEDALTVDRKFLPSLTTKLTTRFVFLSNELPRFSDASGALAGRFLILRLTRSFYGAEDHGLTQRLQAELPGILNWAIEGWRDLQALGRFVQPESVREIVAELEELGSPVKAFLREECILAAGLRVPIDDLYRRWTDWCGRDGRQSVSTKQRFGRDLSAAAPGVTSRRGTGNVRYYEGIGLLQTEEIF